MFYSWNYDDGGSCKKYRCEKRKDEERNDH